MSFDAARRKPARQPKAVAAGFESQRNPRNIATGPNCLTPPAVQHRKQPFWARLQLLARLTLNTRNYAADQPARLAQLDDGNDRAILVQGDEGPAQVVRLGHRGTPFGSIAATKLPRPRRTPHRILRFQISEQCFFYASKPKTDREPRPVLMTDNGSFTVSRARMARVAKPPEGGNARRWQPGASTPSLDCRPRPTGHAEAEWLYRRALAIFERSVGPDHPNVGIVRGNLASFMKDTKRQPKTETTAKPEVHKVGSARAKP